MRAASLDRHVRREARQLVREARAALKLRGKKLREKSDQLTSATTAVERALEAKDLQRARQALPTLDMLLDELVERPKKSSSRNFVESIGGAILIALALRAFVVEAFKIPTSSMYPTLEINDHIFVNKFIYGLRVPWTNIKFFKWRGPERGEVIVFEQPCENRDYIKRVIGTAGDKVEVRCGNVFVNGAPIPSQLTDRTCVRDEYQHAWGTVECSRYDETVGDLVYSTFHKRDRPGNEQLPSPADDFPDETPYTCQYQRHLAAGDPAPDQLPGSIVTTDPNPSDPCKPYRHYVVPEGHVFVMGDNRPFSNDSRAWGSVPLDRIKGKAMFIWLSYRDGVGELRYPRIGNFVH